MMRFVFWGFFAFLALCLAQRAGAMRRFDVKTLPSADALGGLWFQLGGGSKSEQSLSPGVMSLSNSTLSVFLHCPSKATLEPRYSNCPDIEAAASLVTCTIQLGMEDNVTIEWKSRKHAAQCFSITGCSSGNCLEKLQYVKVCHASAPFVLHKWKAAIDDSLVDCSQMAERLPAEIGRAVRKVSEEALNISMTANPKWQVVDAHGISFWKVTDRRSVCVRSEKTNRSGNISVKNSGTIVHGHVKDDWLALADEPGFIMIRDGTREFLEMQPQKCAPITCVADAVEGLIVRTLDHAEDILAVMEPWQRGSFKGDYAGKRGRIANLTDAGNAYVHFDDGGFAILPCGVLLFCEIHAPYEVVLPKMRRIGASKSSDLMEEERIPSGLQIFPVKIEVLSNGVERVCFLFQGIRGWLSVREADGREVLRPLKKIEDHEKAPDAFSPFVAGKESARAVVLSVVEADFRGEVIRHRPGKNSGSGASFFFSANRAFIAKRVRPMELDALWGLVNDGSYARLYEDGSLLNAIYLGFRSSRVGGVEDCWIVMKTEQLPASFSKHLLGFEHSKSFFYDVKPTKMVSDRKQAMQLSIAEHIRTGFSMQDLVGWHRIEDMLSVDTAFLDERSIVDYSLLLYGAFFDVHAVKDANTSLTALDILAQMHTSIKDDPKCAFGCRGTNADNTKYLANFTVASRTNSSERVSSLPDRALRQFIDISDVMDAANAVEFEGSKYRCCCTRFDTFGSLRLEQPCVLISYAAPLRASLMRRNHCGNLLEENYHSYYKTALVPLVKGRCLVNAQVLPSESTLKGVSEERLKLLVPHLLPAWRLPGVKIPNPKIGVCGVTCVSIVDYLLPFNAWNKFENAMLSIRYGEFKWSSYDRKVRQLLRCIGRSGDCYIDGDIIQDAAAEMVDMLVLRFNS